VVLLLTLVVVVVAELKIRPAEVVMEAVEAVVAVL
jgi:hypothetical protein